MFSGLISLSKLLDRRGDQVQQGIAWPRDRWKNAFPAQSVFSTLPDTLDREQVRRACAEAGASEDAARKAFLATMAWGYFKVGYGPWRVKQAFEDDDAGRKLHDVAVVLE
jgi:hypothetical protein